MARHYPERIKQLLNMYERARVSGLFTDAYFANRDVVEIEETIGSLEPGMFPDPKVVALHPQQTRKVVFTRHRKIIGLVDQNIKFLINPLPLWWIEAEGYFITGGPHPDIPNLTGPIFERILKIVIAIQGLPAPNEDGFMLVPPDIAAQFEPPAIAEPPKPPQRWGWHVVKIEDKPIVFDTEKEALAFI